MMQGTQVQERDTVIQGAFVERPPTSARWQELGRTPSSLESKSTWQKNTNGSGFTFRTELKQMEGRLTNQFNQLHDHLKQNYHQDQHTMSQWFTSLDGRLLAALGDLDRKVSALLAEQRSQASRRMTLWLMGLLTVLGVYIVVIHPLTRDPKPVMPTLGQENSNTPIVNPPLPQDLPGIEE
jgi:hypothetical protein